ncbi:MAG TPA: hypothetical protein VFB43_09065 [Terracidiphilus sp.]|nr:hypothetical protein [Terracidiphilus sp.]
MACRWRVGSLGIVAACILAVSGSGTRAQTASVQAHPKPLKERLIPEHLPSQPTIAPTWSIPVDPLGFSPPGPIYLGARNALASLDFIGEDKILFTFRVPGLLHRDRGSGASGEERQVRAIVLSLPQGSVDAEAVWTLHDRIRYLWMLNDGHFLLRDRNSLMVGDASLTLKPFLQFPGHLLWVELDPAQQLIVTDSHEPAKTETKPGQAPSPSSASATVDSDQEPDESTKDSVPDTVVRILRRDSGKVMLVSRVRNVVHLPINSKGYIEGLRSQGWGWRLNLSYFEGGSKMMGNVDSRCDPIGNFVSEREILVTTCTPDGGDKLVAMSTEGQTLWIDQTPAVAVWPEITMAPNGLRIARETLGVTHAVNTYAPIDASDIKGQWVTIYDAATGDLALETPVSPALDMGGNVAISPSGKRVAVLNAGAIQVFELPAPPPLPAAVSEAGAR